MPNHVHVVAVPERFDSLAKALGHAHNAYSRYLNAVGCVRSETGEKFWRNRRGSMRGGRPDCEMRLGAVSPSERRTSWKGCSRIRVSIWRSAGVVGRSRNGEQEQLPGALKRHN